MLNIPYFTQLWNSQFAKKTNSTFSIFYKFFRKFFRCICNFVQKILFLIGYAVFCGENTRKSSLCPLGNLPENLHFGVDNFAKIPRLGTAQAGNDKTPGKFGAAGYICSSPVGSATLFRIAKRKIGRKMPRVNTLNTVKISPYLGLAFL